MNFENPRGNFSSPGSVREIGWRFFVEIGEFGEDDRVREENREIRRVLLIRFDE